MYVAARCDNKTNDMLSLENDSNQTENISIEKQHSPKASDCAALFSHQFKPCLKFVLGDLSCFAGGFHLSGRFAPSVELI